MQRDSAKESVADAKESMNAATNAFQAKHREVEPLQTGKKNQNDLQRNVQAEYRDLEVRSEQELDAKVNMHRNLGITDVTSKHSITSSMVPKVAFSTVNSSSSSSSVHAGWDFHAILCSSSCCCLADQGYGKPHGT